MQSCFMRQFIHSAWRCDCLHVFDLLLSRPYGGHQRLRSPFRHECRSGLPPTFSESLLHLPFAPLIFIR